jgi:hypothetical protein
MTVKAETVSIKHGGAVSAVLGFDLTGPRLRAMALGAVFACLVALVAPELLTGGSRETMAVHEGSTGQPVKSMPPSLVPALSESFGASARRFWSVRRGAALLTAGGGVRSTFNASGVAMRVGQGTLGLALAGVGRGSRFDPVAAVAPRGSANRVLYRHGSVSEFYRNGPFGLEQGFVVRHRPLAHGSPLTILLRVRGSLTPERVGAQVLFRAPAGAVAVSYGRLSAVDATGRRLRVSMWVGNGTLQLRVGDRNAHYPLRIDPFIQQGAKLTGDGEAGGGEFGSSVALSADGNTALVGAPGDSGGAGAAWLFTRSGSTWTQQGEKLTGAGETGVARFGGSVALSAGGDTALIGGARDAEGVGAAWLFTRSASTWAQQGEKLTGAGEWGPGAFGQSVALSSDGSTALIGAPMDHPFALAAGVGAAWVFTHTGGAWTQQGEKLTGAGGGGPARFGSSVALSADGNTAMIGGPNDGWCIGAAWILVRSGGVWNQQAMLPGELEGTACDDGPDDGETDELLFGTAVALSADGNVGLVSRPFLDALRLGETGSYARVGSSWTGKTALRDRKGAKAGASSLAVSADGQHVLLGKGEIEGRDSALAYVRAGSEWAQEGLGLQASGRAGFSAFGGSVALSSSASTALIGGLADNGNVGAAWVFSKQVLPLPTAVTAVASSVTRASAALNGSVNPNGQEVFNCHFEYGTTTSYGSSTPCSASPGAGESPVEASAPAQGLTANTTYHFRLVAANGGGVAYGADKTLTTLPGPPAVVTRDASVITRTAATLNASVNPLGETMSDCHFEYGISASYGSSVPCSQLPGSGSGAVDVSAPVGSLGEYHPYHFRIVATNEFGTSYGADRTFNTLSNAPEFGRCLEVTPHTGLYAQNGCTKWGSGMRYEWHPGAVGVHFTVQLIAGAAAFETVKRSLITCTSETGSGEYTGQKTLGGILLTFAGCTQLGQKCTSLLAAEGELVTNLLEGVLGVIGLGSTSASNKIGLELVPAEKAGAFMEFTCGLTAVTFRGAVIVPVVANKMLTATTLKYSASRGKQHPERFLGEPAAILEASFGNKAYEQTGLTLEATKTSGAPVETNSVA